MQVHYYGHYQEHKIDYSFHNNNAEEQLFMNSCSWGLSVVCNS